MINNYKLRLSIAIFSALLCATTSRANDMYDFEVDGIFYVITSETDLEVGVSREHSTLNDTDGGDYSGDIVIPETVTYDGCTYTVTSIETGAFMWSYSLTSIELPNSLTTIDPLSFDGCTSLTSVVIPNSVVSIGSYAFLECPNITNIVIGSSVAEIGYCILDSEVMTDVYSLNVTPPTCDYNYTGGVYSFFELTCEEATLHVPSSAVEDYKNDEAWGLFANIVAIDTDEETGISEIEATDDETYVVYTISGVLVMKTSDSSMLDSLPEGLYIVNGKKVVIKK